MGNASRFIGGASQGLGRLAQALAGGQGAYQDAYDQQLGARSKFVQAMAAAEAAQATADKNRVDADQGRRVLELQGPEAIRSRALMANGVPLDSAGEVDNFLTSGRIDRFDPNAGPAMPAPEWAAPQNLTRIGQSIAQELSTIGGGSKSAKDFFDGRNQQFETALAQAIAAGLPPDQMARGMALLKASPMFKPAEGYTGNVYTGAIDMKAPENVARSGYVAAQTGAQKANAAQSYAAADASRASAEKTRLETNDGTNRKGAKAPTGYRWSADGATLEAIPGGPADPATKGAKLARPPTEGQAKALIFSSRMAVADEILGDLDGKYSVPGVNNMQAATNLPGGAVLAGPIVNSQLSPATRQAAQAQRDFINAVLRRESGAVISPEEFRNAAQQYFPQPGDDPATKAQKAENRRVAIEGMKAEFGEQSLPEFERIVAQARQSRAGRAPGKQSGPANAAAGAASAPVAPAAGGQRNIVVNY